MITKHSQALNKAFLAILFVALMFTMPCNAAITSYNNSVTSDDSQYFNLNYSQSVTFNVEGVNVTQYDWYVDSQPIINNFDNYTTAFTVRGMHNVTVEVTNVSGTDIVIWLPIVSRQVTTGSIAQINDSAKDEVIESFEEPNFEKFLSGTMQPYTDILGPLFFMFLFGFPFVMQWIRQGSVLIPAVSGTILGGLLLSFFPEEYVQYAILFVGIGIMSALYALFKDR